MKWFRKDNNPVTTENRVALENEQGIEGYISVRFVAGHATYYGVVFAVKRTFDNHGTVIDEKHTVLDRFPTIDGKSIGQTEEAVQQSEE